MTFFQLMAQMHNIIFSNMKSESHRKKNYRRGLMIIIYD